MQCAVYASYIPYNHVHYFKNAQTEKIYTRCAKNLGTENGLVDFATTSMSREMPITFRLPADLFQLQSAKALLPAECFRPNRTNLQVYHFLY